MEWLDTALVYSVTDTSLTGALSRMFGILGNVLDAFWLPVQAAAAVYIALMGYALMSGAISMPAREVAIRFAKVIGIIFLMRTFSLYGFSLFNAVWSIPDAIADYYAEQISPLLQFTGFIGIDSIDSLAGTYGLQTQILSSQVTEAHGLQDGPKWGFWTWIISMAPLALTIVSIFIAKFVAALLFLVSPIVFILSLTIGNFNNSNILMSWFKSLAMTFITVIFIYIVGITCVAMMARYIVALIAFDAGIGILDIFGLGGILGAKYTLVHLAPLGVMAVFSIVLLSQATNVAGALMSIAAINTQQMTSFAQISALNAAPR